jgi:hypothetical protein
MTKNTASVLLQKIFFVFLVKQAILLSKPRGFTLFVLTLPGDVKPFMLEKIELSQENI